jgi:hypothetical protein
MRSWNIGKSKAKSSGGAEKEGRVQEGRTKVREVGRKARSTLKKKVQYMYMYKYKKGICFVLSFYKHL